MVFGLDGGQYGIQHLPVGLLVLCCYGLVLYEGLSVFALKHHLELFPARSGLIGFISVNVEGFKGVEGSHVELLPVLRLMGRYKAELRGLPAWGGVFAGCHCNFGR